ncbi:hypothetical protein O3P69_015300 [Scylla paramamosain]|uniref:Uncharacterized protein n=1 Tax=Scylla paramamosain TaxID=85552 RepID=A0AAW0T4F1_SCYPA
MTRRYEESPRRRSKNETPVKPSSPAPSPPVKSEQPPLMPIAAQPDKAGNNRYISTLVWVPRLTPSTYSTTLIVSAQDPAFSEVICIKQGGASSDNLAEARKH